MSSVIRDVAEGHQTIARDIARFSWEDRPHKSVKKERTVEELEAELERIRLQCWDYYNQAATHLGWNR